MTHASRPSKAIVPTGANLPRFERRLLESIAPRAGRRPGTVFLATTDSIADCLGVSRRHVQRGIKALAEGGLIEVDRKGRRGILRITITGEGGGR